MRGADGLVSSLALVAFVVTAVYVGRSRLRARRAGHEGADETPVGQRSEGKRAVRVGLGREELQQGVLVGGSPGAGKTTLLAGINQGTPAEVGVRVRRPEGRSSACRSGWDPDDERVFGLGDRGGRGRWSPLERGNPASWRDILMATQEWSEPHYRRRRRASSVRASPG